MVALALLSGCSRPVSPRGNNQPGLPFHSDDDTAHAEGATPHPGTTDPGTTDAGVHNMADGVPFKTPSSWGAPAGTLLTVRLQSSLSTAKRDAGQTFAAVVTEPVMIAGRTVVPRNAEVRGRVEAANVSSAGRNAGYLRLTLDSIHIDDRDVPLQTASLFARGTARASQYPLASGNSSTPVAPRPGVVRLRKGRRLTFRLTADLAPDHDADKSPVGGVSEKSQPTTK